MPSGRWRRAACTLLFLSTASSLSAQTPTIVPDRVHCGSCKVTLVKVAELGNEYGEPGAQGGANVLVRDSRGYIYGVYGGASTEIVVHAPSGKVVGKVGRQGGGPGEFQRISEIVIAPGDTLHVFDIINRRRTILSPAWKPVATSPLPGGAISAIRLADGRMIINSNIPAPKLPGLPLHSIGQTGQLLHSFGADTSSPSPDLARGPIRKLSNADGATFWAGHYNEYRLEQWTGEGKLLTTLLRQPSWSKPSTTQTALSPNTPPQPFMVGLRQNAEGRLLVITRIPDREWRKALESTRDEFGKATYRVGNPDQGYDSMIEVIDPATGRLLLSQQFPQALGDFIDADHIVSYAADEAGHRYITVWSVQLVLQ